MKKILFGIIALVFVIYCLSKCASCGSEKIDKATSPSITLKDPATFTKFEKDSIAKSEKDKINTQKAFGKTKAGKLQSKHPDWTVDDCDKVLAKQIWIGMEYDMLVAERGRPNKINKSNYGNGEQYQFCWDDYTPGCFYSGDDYIITAYN